MTTLIVTSIVSLIVGGGITKLASLKDDKRASAANALSLEIENLRTVLNEVRTQSDIDKKNFYEEREFWKSEKDALKEEVGVLRSTVMQLTEKLDEVNNKFEKADALKCLNLACEHRDPPIYNFNLKNETVDNEEQVNKKSKRHYKKK